MIFSFGSFLISSSTSRPSLFGRFRSRRMMSGRGVFACAPSRRRIAIASSPSQATVMWWITFPSLNASSVSRTSPGLSSTSRISMGLVPVSVATSAPPLRRYGKEKRRSFARLRFQPDAAAVALHDLFADRKADPGPGIFHFPMQPLEYRENPFEIFRIDPDAVVRDRKNPFLAVLPSRNMNPCPFPAAEFEGVPDQVLEQLDHLRPVRLQGGKRIV